MLNEKNIEEFLEEYQRSRIIIPTTIRSVLKSVAKYEKIYNKDFVDFTMGEVLQMFSSVKSISITGLQNQKTLMAHAARYFLDKERKPLDNIYDTITKDILMGCLDVDKKRNRLITREQLTDMQDQLWNKTDQAILEALWLGMGGKWCTELTYLTPEQVVKSDMKIYFKNGKVIDIDNRVYQMLKNAFNETELLSYTETAKATTVIGKSLYKYRFNTVHMNADAKDMADAERRYRYIQRRLGLMSDYLAVPLTTRGLNLSGLWYYMNVEREKMGIEDFRQYLHTENAKKLAARYDFKSKYYVGILMQRFQEFI